MKHHILFLSALLTFAVSLCQAATLIVVNVGSSPCAPAPTVIPGLPSCNPASSFVAISQQWSMQEQVTASGAAAGRPTFADQVFTKKFDASSAKLLTSMLAGTNIPSLLISYYAPNGASALAKMPLYQILLTNVIVTGMSSQESSGGGLPTETVSFSWTVMKVTINTLQPTGAAGPSYWYSYNRETNAFSSN